jgi:Sigma-70, region 4
MGASKRDMEKKSRQYEENYPYEAAGIAALLRDINSLSESRLYNGDIDATVLLADLKQALDSECLTPRMRQVVALYYFAQMTEQEVADVLGVTRQAINIAIESALERVSTFMEFGYGKPTNARIDARITPTHPFLDWVNEVAAGDQPVYSYSDDITHWLAGKGDKMAQETIKQSVEGHTYLPVYEGDTEEYPALTEDQFKWRDRRMTFAEEIFPQRDTSGFRKVATILEDGSKCDWSLERKRLFI